MKVLFMQPCPLGERCVKCPPTSPCCLPQDRQSPPCSPGTRRMTKYLTCIALSSIGRVIFGANRVFSLRSGRRLLRLTNSLVASLPLFMLNGSAQAAEEESVCIENATIGDLQEALAGGKISAAALARAYLARIEADDRADP